ncbi:MAG: acyltransferase family protein [Deltaproteobacteria bacterium]|nr:acyltransferase family protein [Deltaproteobacteria bacterium]
MSAPERYHAFDALRASAMLLGVFFHASLAYVEPVQPYWIVQDANRSLAFGAFAWASHSFRMQTFFAMSGFFARLLCQRRGARAFARHRTLRILLPFTVGVALDNLIQQSFLSWAHASSLFTPHALEMATIAGETLSPASYVRNFRLGVYWFLEYLAVLSLVVWLCSFWRPPTDPPEGRSPSLTRLLGSRSRAFLLALPHAALLWPMEPWGVGSPTGLLPELSWLAYYGLFFAFGWFLHLHRDQLTDLVSGWRRDLTLAAPVGAAALAGAVAGSSGWLPESSRGVVLWLTASFTWLMVLGLTGLFLQVFNRDRAWVRYLSDASYWFYLTHDYWVQGMQILLFPFALPSLFKYVFVLSIAGILLLFTYEFGVRYTAVGAALHGWKHRPGPSFDEAR